MPAKKKPAPKRKAAPRKAATKAATKAAPRKAAPRKAATKAAPGKAMKPRADYGSPVDPWFARQPAALRPIADALRVLVAEAAPDAASSIKWGMPFYAIGDTMMCAIGGHKAHINLILSGPPGTYPDPARLLLGDGKTGKHLKLASLAELPRDQVRRWLAIAATRARA